MEKIKDINRIKVVPAEKKRNNKWLAGQLKESSCAISKWCTNTSPPSLETILRTAGLLEVNYRVLVGAECLNKSNRIIR